ncbi:MAG TPA: cupin domain-containing protein [Solirubrobacteraceae bacterium]|nr:cupin domain-containing protein [Solirubrobacteraceae bacterium]
MHRVNLADPTFTYDDDDPEGFRSGMFRMGPRLGAQDTGTTLYELPPGQALCPYHYEYGEEEWLLVLEGRPTVRTPDGEEPADPLDVVFFPKGRDGAHQVRNDTDTTVRVLMWSTVVYPTATAYPDSDKVGVWTGVREEDLMAPRSANVEYYFGET